MQPSNSAITSTLDLSGETNNVTDQAGWAWYTAGTTVDGKVYNVKVLVLSGLDVTCSTDTIGIKVPDATTIVTLQDSVNNVTAADNASGDSFGIYSTGSVTLDGPRRAEC